jgi:hypothetical protein
VDLLGGLLLQLLLFSMRLLVGGAALEGGVGQCDHLLLQGGVRLRRRLKHVAHLTHLGGDLADLRRGCRAKPAALQPSWLRAHAQARDLHRRRPADAQVPSLEAERERAVLGRLVGTLVEGRVHRRLERQRDGNGRFDADEPLQVALVRLHREDDSGTSRALEEGVAFFPAFEAALVQLALQHHVDHGLDARRGQE